MEAAPSSPLVAAQGRFLDSLEPRMAALTTELETLTASADPEVAKGRLRRRLEAMSETARALDLDAVASAFASAELVLAQSVDCPTQDEVHSVAAILKLVPSLCPPPVAPGPTPTPPLASEDPAKLFERAWAEASNHTPTAALAPPTVHTPAPSNARPAPAPSLAAPEDSRAANTPAAVDPIARAQLNSPDAPALRAPEPKSSRVSDLGGERTDSLAQGRQRRAGATGTSLAERRIVVALKSPDSAVRSLEAAGASVTSTATRGALEAALYDVGAPPDALLLQLRIDDVDGFALARKLSGDLLLRDVPVLLVDDDEQALKRADELGAGAAAYVPTAALDSAASFASDALHGRMGLAARLARQEVVMGRLDGLTAALLVRLAMEHARATRITVRDAAFEHELVTRGDEVISATRHYRGGASVTDPRSVLRTLIGTRAGSFCVERVEPDSATGEPYAALLTPLVERARELAQRVAEGALAKTDAVDIDWDVAEPYLATSPQSVTRLANGLAAGRAPRELLAQGDAALLESLLLDLIGRGAVLALGSGAETRRQPFQLGHRGPRDRPSRAVAPAPHVQPAASSTTPAASPQLAPASAAAPATARVAAPAAAAPWWDVDQSTDLSLLIQRRLEHSPVAAAPVLDNEAAAAPRRSKGSRGARDGVPSPAIRKRTSRPAPPSGHAAAAPDPDLASDAALGARGEGSGPSRALGWFKGRRDQLRGVLDRHRSAYLAAHPAHAPRDSSPAPETSEPTADADAAIATTDSPNADADAARSDSAATSPELMAGSAVPEFHDTLPHCQPAPGPTRRRPARDLLASARHKLPRIIAPALVLGVTAFGAHWTISRLTQKVELVTAELEPALDPALEPSPALATSGAAAPPQQSKNSLLERPGSSPKAEAGESQLDLHPIAMDLPPGVMVDEGKGLLEINTGDTHRIEIDGTFIGRGPIRRVPLTPGKHAVALRSSTKTTRLEVEITAGKRTRLQPLAQAAK